MQLSMGSEMSEEEGNLGGKFSDVEDGVDRDCQSGEDRRPRCVTGDVRSQAG
jgi:hypothetical protein